MPRLLKYLYHGTSLHRWKQLEADNYETEIIYLARSPERTVHYRLNAVEQDEIDDAVNQDDNAEVIAKFELQTLIKQGELMPDWDDVRTNMELFPDAVEPQDVSWIDSLRVLGTCSYEGSLKEALKAVRVIR